MFLLRKCTPHLKLNFLAFLMSDGCYIIFEMNVLW